MYYLYDSLYNELTVESNALLKALNVSESIAEGEYTDYRKKEPNIGGFSVYTFSRNDTVYRIRFSGGKNNAYVTKTFYYWNYQLIFAERTIRSWENVSANPYKVEEFYFGKYLETKKTGKLPPKGTDTSLIQLSLFKDGMKYLLDYRRN